jgi:hypothetical protein
VVPLPGEFDVGRLNAPFRLVSFYLSFTVSCRRTSDVPRDAKILAPQATVQVQVQGSQLLLLTDD